jgi:hypothetical protein
MRPRSLALLAIGVILLLSSWLIASAPTGAHPPLQVTVTPTVFVYLPFEAKNWPPIEYQGTTGQDLPISVRALPDFSGVNRVSLTHQFECDGIKVDGTVTVSRPTDPWPIEDRAFSVEARCSYVVTGTFTADFESVSGTWQGIACNPSTWQEICRGPTGYWSATRQP